MTEPYHIPVLLEESVNNLNIRENGIYADLTFGGGGHSRAILEKLGQNGKLLVFDRDKDSIANIPNDNRIIFALSNFRYLNNFAKYYEIREFDGIIADLGVSSHHFDESQRGFSFRFDGPLDMRMNQDSELTAAYIINNYHESQLSDIFFYYGELSQSKRLASEIVKKRTQKNIDTIFEFTQIVERFCGKDKKKDLAKIFQALRIEVNDELGSLKAMLLETIKALKPKGRLVIITYHSLEDRLVKNFMKSGNFEGILEKDFYGKVIAPFTPKGKVIIPSDAEIEGNPRSRSAKLRVAERN